MIKIERSKFYENPIIALKDKKSYKKCIDIDSEPLINKKNFLPPAFHGTMALQVCYNLLRHVFFIDRYHKRTRV